MSRYLQLPSDEPLDADSDGDAEEQTNSERPVPMMDAVLAERLQLEELSVRDEDTAALALQFAEYGASPLDTRPESKSRQDKSYSSGLQQPSSAPRHDNAPAIQLFDAAFPSGHKVLQTPGTNLRCGLYAIILSYENQYSSRANQPTLDTLMEVVNSVPYREVVSRPQGATNAHEASLMVAGQQVRQQARTRSQKKALGEDIGEFLQNDRYFSPDQLDLLLRLWGESNGLRLRLGYLHGDEAKLLGRGDGGDQADVVWIHFRSRGAGHYSGLAHNTGSQKGQAGNKGRGTSVKPQEGSKGRDSNKRQLQYKGKRGWTR